MNHFAFVAASYGASALFISALIIWIVMTSRARRAELGMLEQAGIRRRSDAA